MIANPKFYKNIKKRAESGDQLAKLIDSMIVAQAIAAVISFSVLSILAVMYF